MIAHSSSSFLEYYKVILQKVSFDEDLFVKEYHKAVNSLDADEISILNRWIVLNKLDDKLHKVKVLKKE